MASLGTLSKCRLCLKLGEFYSIFAEDNSVQLARMAMACSDVQIKQGDGLPDKVCGECVEKLSAAYIFKQQCERSDAELRKSLTIPKSSNSKSNESKSFSQPSVDTKPLYQKENSSNRRKRRTNKRNYSDNESENEFESKKLPQSSNLLQERYSVHVPNTLSTEGTQTGCNVQTKKRRLSDSSNVHNTTNSTGITKDTVECHICNQVFSNFRGVCAHQRVHKNEANEKAQLMSQFISESVTPREDETNDNSITIKRERFKCEYCDKTYRTKVIYLEHVDQCRNSELDENDFNSIEKALNHLKCPVCKQKYKKRIYLRKHIGRSTCGEVTISNGSKRESITIKAVVKEFFNNLTKAKYIQCSNCNVMLRNYVVMMKHFIKCISVNGIIRIACTTCDLNFPDKKQYIKHLRSTHFSNKKSSDICENDSKIKHNSLQCPKCDKVLENKTKLVMHLAAHMTNIDISSKVTLKTNGLPFKCYGCPKKFRFKSSLINHIKIHKNASPTPTDENKPYVCEICGKGFEYAKSVAIHKTRKHAPVAVETNCSYINSDCSFEFSKLPAQCLHCNLLLENRRETKLHNMMHLKNNEKPKNEYTCPECGMKFTNTKIFQNHYREHNIDNDNNEEIYDASISNFCEVTSDLVRESDTEADLSCNDIKPILSTNEFACTLCNKKFTVLNDYYRHMASHENDFEQKPNDEYSCFICNKVFNEESGFQMHMKIHYYDKNIDSKLLNCKLCNRPSKNMRAYIAHMSWHSIIGRYKCHLCQETFTYSKMYNNHMLTIHCINNVAVSQATEYRCNICNKYFDRHNSLQYHLMCHQNGDNLDDKLESFNCALCKREFLSNYRLVMHMLSNHNILLKSENSENKTIHDNKTFNCVICNMTFMSQMGLTKHVNKCHPADIMVKKQESTSESKPPHRCALCSKQFSNIVEFKTHLNEHDDEPKVLRCTICHRKSQSLKTHLIHLSKTHLRADDSVECEHCNEKFARRRELRMHLRVYHNIVENYVEKLNKEEALKVKNLEELQCHICGKVLRSENTYEKHLLWHNARRCNYCLKYFNTKGFLLAHIAYNCDKKKLLGNADPFSKKLKCYICLKPFSIAVKLNCHLKVQHNIDSVNNGVNYKASTCDFCFSVFDSEERMLSHKKCHSPSRSVQCKLCSKGIHPVHFKKHKIQHSTESFEESPLQCEHCEEKFNLVRDYSTHLSTVHKMSMVWFIPKEGVLEECNICHKSFMNLPRHLKYHEKYKCKKCSQHFFSEILFNEHICEIESDEEVDSGIKNDKTDVSLEVQTDKIIIDFEECKFCFKPFTSPYSKSKHIYNHNNIFSFGCRLCPRKFTIKSAFKQHFAAHKNHDFTNNPLKCRHCDDVFTKYQLYCEHMENVHNDPEKLEYHPAFPPQPCVICNHSFANIYRHYKYHQEMQCPNCLKYILSHKYFLNHKCDDENEDSSLVAQYEGDISALLMPDYSSYEIKRAVVSEENESFEIHNNENEHENTESYEDIDFHLRNDISASHKSSDNFYSFKSDNTDFSFDNFSPVISSTVSLSSSNLCTEKEQNRDIPNLDIKIEPTDQHYYKNYNQYEFQNSFFDINSTSG